MKGIMTDDYKNAINTHSYKKGQIVEVTELPSFNNVYAVYYENDLDWIPKHLVRILKKLD